MPRKADKRRDDDADVYKLCGGRCGISRPARIRCYVLTCLTAVVCLFAFILVDVLNTEVFSAFSTTTGAVFGVVSVVYSFRREKTARRRIRYAPRIPKDARSRTCRWRIEYRWQQLKILLNYYWLNEFVPMVLSGYATAAFPGIWIGAAYNLGQPPHLEQHSSFFLRVMGVCATCGCAIGFLIALGLKIGHNVPKAERSMGWEVASLLVGSWGVSFIAAGAAAIFGATCGFCIATFVFFWESNIIFAAAGLFSLWLAACVFPLLMARAMLHNSERVENFTGVIGKEDIVGDEDAEISLAAAEKARNKFSIEPKVVKVRIKFAVAKQKKRYRRWRLQRQQKRNLRESLKTNDNDPLLLQAIKAKRLEAAEATISRGARVNSIQDGHRQIDHACKVGAVEIVRLLISKKARYWDLFPATGVGRRRDEWSPLHHAVAGGHLDCVTLLLEQKRIDANIQSSMRGVTPLHIGVEVGQTACVKALLAHDGIDVLQVSEDGVGPDELLKMAKMRGDKKLLKALKKAIKGAKAAKKADHAAAGWVSHGKTSLRKLFAGSAKVDVGAAEANRERGSDSATDQKAPSAGDGAVESKA